MVTLQTIVIPVSVVNCAFPPVPVHVELRDGNLLVHPPPARNVSPDWQWAYGPINLSLLKEVQQVRCLLLCKRIYPLRYIIAVRMEPYAIVSRLENKSM